MNHKTEKEFGIDGRLMPMTLHSVSECLFVIGMFAGLLLFSVKNFVTFVMTFSKLKISV